jgi:hypothetical protein
MTLASRATAILCCTAAVVALSNVPTEAAGPGSGGVGIAPTSPQAAPTDTSPTIGDLAPMPTPAPAPVPVATTTTASGGAGIPVSAAAPSRTSQPDTGVAVSGTLVATPGFATKPVPSVTKPVSSVLGVTVSRPRRHHKHPASSFCEEVKSSWVAGVPGAVGGVAHVVTGGAGLSSDAPSCLMPTGGAGLIG